MVEHIERIWSSNIGDWESYWVDCDFFTGAFVGYPAEDAKVPDLKRKGLDEVSLVFSKLQ